MGAWEGGGREGGRLDSIRGEEGAGETAETAKKKLFSQRRAAPLQRVINI